MTTPSFFRVAAAVPACAVADPRKNVQRICELARAADAEHVAAVCFPELCITGYTARDLFLDTTLSREVDAALSTLIEVSTEISAVLIVGTPLESRHRLYNAAAVIQGGRLLGVVPKSFMPRSGEFEETRWFRSGRELEESSLTICGQSVPFGLDLIFKSDVMPECSFGIELCEDLWHAKPPSSVLYQEGALTMFNLSASNFLVGKAEQRRLLVQASASRGIGGYIYVAAGPTESSTDLAFDADAFICERDEILVESERFSRAAQLIVTDLDVTALCFARRKNQVFGDGARQQIREITWSLPAQQWPPRRSFSQRPFVSDEPAVHDRRAWEVFEIQSNALATRMNAIGKPKLVLGLSGGIDSTHAALVAVEALRICDQPATDLICLGLPGFGSSTQTQENGQALADALGVSFEVLPIADLSTEVLRGIGHGVVLNDNTTPDEIIEVLKNVPELGDTSFENVQARLRTLLLMSKANQVGGLVVGTGDLSEKALGWSTYAGDQISMYDVNAGVPKSLIQDVMRWVVAHRAVRWNAQKTRLEDALSAVLDTPISPELLPPSDTGDVAQLTESVLGPYVVHDFFLYHFQAYGRSFDEILDLATLTFRGTYDAEALRSFAVTFVQRFFANQFKRSCTPDAPKVLTVGLSPRGDWRMPSDAKSAVWLATIKNWQPKVST